MIVAITGGSGFIGRHLAQRHLAAGDEVRVLTRRDGLAELPGARLFRGDLAQANAPLEAFADGAEVMYHCAAELADADAMAAVNTEGTRRLLAAAAGRSRRWVQLSSTGVYGSHPNRVVNEDAVPAPGNAYERTKAAADALVESAMAAGMPAVILRPSNVFGPGMRNRSLHQLARALHRGWFFFIGPPGARVNYIDVANVVDALILAAASPAAVGRTYIVSDGLPLEEFIGAMAGAVEVRPPRMRVPAGIARAAAAAGALLPGFPLSPSRVAALTDRTHYDASRIGRELGHRNTVPLAEGIARFVRAEAGA